MLASKPYDPLNFADISCTQRNLYNGFCIICKPGFSIESGLCIPMSNITKETFLDKYINKYSISVLVIVCTISLLYLLTYKLRNRRIERLQEDNYNLYENSRDNKMELEYDTKMELEYETTSSDEDIPASQYGKHRKFIEDFQSHKTC